MGVPPQEHGYESIPLDGLVTNMSRASWSAQPRTPETWTAIIPVRSFVEGKSRLLLDPREGAPLDRYDLIRAFTTDVVHACVTSSRITRTVVVSPDQRVIEHARACGADVAFETAPSGINEAVSFARSDVQGPIAVILGDTPCLTGSILDVVLGAAAGHDVTFVPDAAGVGTTIWCDSGPSPAHSHFGRHSRAEHRLHGAYELGCGERSAEWARARRDVDTDVDLWDAHRLGLGEATQQLLTSR